MKKKYQVIIGLLLSMTALFMLSCEDVMTGNLQKGQDNISVEQGQSGARMVYSAIFVNPKRTGNVVEVTVRATGEQYGNTLEFWNGSRITSFIEISGPRHYSGSGVYVVRDYYYKFNVSGSGTFRWACDNADISCTIN